MSINRKSFFTDHKLNRPFNYAYQLERKLHFVIDPVGESIDVLVVIASNYLVPRVGAFVGEVKMCSDHDWRRCALSKTFQSRMTFFFVFFCLFFYNTFSTRIFC